MGAPGKPSPASRENGKLGGRPIGTANLYNQEFRKRLAEQIMKEEAEWREAIAAPAKGYWYEEVRPDGTKKIYKTKPDPNAWEKAMNRAFGQPKIEIEQKPDEETKEVIANMGEEVNKIRQEFEDKLKEQLKKNV